MIPFVGDDPELQRRFRNEAQSAAKLDHPGIARVYDAGSHDEWHYIVFEYIEGTNIRDQIASSGVYTIDDAVYYTCQLAGALQHAADRGIVHRDIKPSNVIVGDGGTLKLVDMGLARSEHLELSEDMTASGVTLGTFDYISPEQARDPRNADLRSDIYSLGCTLYFMLTGKPPYPGGTMAQKIISHGTAPPPDVQKFRPAVSNHLTAVLNKMLAKSPNDRYANANDLLADLREVARRDNLTRAFNLAPITVQSAPRPPSQLLRYSPWIAAFVVVLLTAGWMQLESPSMRGEVSIPESAGRPLPVSISDPPTDRAIPQRSNPDALISPKVQSDPIVDLAAETTSEPASTASTASALPAENTTEQDNANARESELEFNPAPRVVRLVDQELNSENDRDESGAALANSFTMAIQLAQKHGAGRIEITTPIVFSEPVQIETTEPLIIRSTVGGSVINFQSHSGLEKQQTTLVSVNSNRVEFEDLHFAWEIPTANSQGGTVIEIHGNRQVRLNRCSLTVRNPKQLENVFGFKVSSDKRFLIFPGRARIEAESNGTQIDIRNSIIRGGMTMLSHDGNLNLQLTWTNGLLAIAGRMIDTTGARIEQELRRNWPIELMLTRLTAHATKGLVRVQTSPEVPHTVAIDRQSLNSLFLVGPQSPQFEIQGLDSNDRLPERLRLRGASNAYVADSLGADPMLWVGIDGKPNEVTSISEIRSNPPNWFQDSSVRWIAYPWFEMAIETIEPGVRTVEDYQQDDPSAAGFDIESLPQIPDTAIPASAPTPGDAVHWRAVHWRGTG